MLNNGYTQLLSRRREEYKKYSSVYCPCLKGDIVFTSDGFNHLRFHVDGTPRNPNEQMYKLGLVPLVIPVIKNAKQIEEYRKLLAPAGRKKKNNKNLKEIQYWSVVAKVGKQKTSVRVILRKVGEGKIHFWSVMKSRKIKKPLVRGAT
jgi:hypothetical protein